MRCSTYSKKLVHVLNGEYSNLYLNVVFHEMIREINYILTEIAFRTEKITIPLPSLKWAFIFDFSLL